MTRSFFLLLVASEWSLREESQSRSWSSSSSAEVLMGGRLDSHRCTFTIQAEVGCCFLLLG